MSFLFHTTCPSPLTIHPLHIFTTFHCNSIIQLSSLSTSLSSTTPANASITPSTNQTALIGALAAGISALVLLLLLAFLLYRRRRRHAIRRQEPRIDSRALPQSALLHDDEMARNAHIRLVPAATPQYQRQSSVTEDDAAATIYRPASPILRSRISESGSIFREEVWPPPSLSVDPIEMRSSQVDLSRIVDDVMGSDKMDGKPNSERRKVHKREDSSTPLLVERQTSSGHGSSEEDYSNLYASPLSTSPTSPLSPPIVDQPNMPFYGVFPEVSPPFFQSQVEHHLRHSTSVTSLSSSVHSTLGPVISPSSVRPPSQGSISSSTFQRTQPKVSSPLVRALTGFGGS